MDLVFDTTQTGQDVARRPPARRRHRPDGQAAEAARAERQAGAAAGRVPLGRLPLHRHGRAVQGDDRLLLAPSGVPLRSSINLTLASQDVEFDSAHEPGRRGRRRTRDRRRGDRADIDRSGRRPGGRWRTSLGDPRAARAIASANGSASLRFSRRRRAGGRRRRRQRCRRQRVFGRRVGRRRLGSVASVGGVGIGDRRRRRNRRWAAGVGIGVSAGAGAGAGSASAPAPGWRSAPRPVPARAAALRRPARGVTATRRRPSRGAARRAPAVGVGVGRDACRRARRRRPRIGAGQRQPVGGRGQARGGAQPRRPTSARTAEHQARRSIRIRSLTMPIVFDEVSAEIAPPPRQAVRPTPTRAAAAGRRRRRADAVEQLRRDAGAAARARAPRRRR